jgi:putative ABC transport system permease protein
MASGADASDVRVGSRGARGPFVGLAHDLRLTGRVIARQPGFAALTIATLALGIGATTTIYALAYHVWLKPLPYANADRLVMIKDADARAGSVAFLSYPEIGEYRAASSLADLAFATYNADVFHDDGTVRQTVVYHVSPNFFTVLGATPAIGRLFSSADVRDADPVAILSDDLWRHAYGADPHIVGRTLHGMNMTATVIGVMPRGVSFPQNAGDLMWIPWRPAYDTSSDRHVRYVRTVGLLKPGVAIERVRAELAAIGQRLAADHPATNSGWSPRATPVIEYLLGGTAGAFGTLLGAVALLLLMTCANVAGLFLARHAARRQDVVVRAALGASRWRLARLAMVEALVVSAIGGVAGVCVASAATPLLAALVPAARIDEARVDVHVLLASLVITVGTGVACGVIPAFGRIRSLPRLRTAARPMATSRTARHWQRLLVVVQIAASLVLASGGGLMVKSFVTLIHVDHGFSADHVLSLTVSSWTSGRVRDDASNRALYHDVIHTLSRLRGVASVALATGAPGSQTGFWGYAALTSARDVRSTEAIADLRASSPGYFSTIGVPLVAGRLFTDRDDADAPPVAIVNEALAKTLWPGEAVVGRTITLPPMGGGRKLVAAPYEIVGVVGDMHIWSSTRPEVFVPFFQTPGFWADIVVRTTSDPAAMASQVREAVRHVDPDVLVEHLAPMTTLLGNSLDFDRAVVLLVSLFAMLAVLIAAIGVYGVLSYLVADRTAEFGLRVALGATPGEVLGDVIRRGLALGVAGTLIGGAATFIAIRLLRQRAFGLHAADPVVIAAAIVTLLLTTLVASYLPARRAMRIEPARAIAREG